MTNATHNHPQNTDATQCPIPWCTTSREEHARDAAGDEFLLHRSATTWVDDPIDEQDGIAVRFTSATEHDCSEIEPAQLYVAGEVMSMAQAEALAATLLEVVAAYRAGRRP